MGSVRLSVSTLANKLQHRKQWWGQVFVPENQIFRGMTAIGTVNLSGKHRQPSEWKGNNAEVSLWKRWCSDGQKRNLTSDFHSVSVCEWALSAAARCFMISDTFYRILMSLLPPPLFTTDKDWNWSVCAALLLAHCRLGTGTRNPVGRKL